ncbi:2-hydroxy-3-oxopropionate reductase [Hyalella azteca]|uniref:2-hydroxy-3-oxopropionate reductase n=1 Tax=Hyalella azteca TaxID=294128 RepID=A0A8B7N1X1_HYAAZ|nr:2-hydroxy-3-oxopropionate reductase [Hyalella azteca]
MLSQLWKCSYRAQMMLSRQISTATKETKIGIIGCGNVGNAVANNLLRKGFNVTSSFDTSKEHMEKMPQGIKHCGSPREVAETCEVIITGLPRPVNVLEAAEGQDGILAGLSKDKVWVDHSTTDNDNTVKFVEEAKTKGAYVLEAPITGGLAALKKGNMVAFMAGDKQAADAVMPIMECSYQRSVYCGAVGSAMMMKVVSNLLAAVNLLALSEVLMLAKRANLDLKLFYEAIRVSAGHSFVWDTGVPFVLQGSYEPGFTMELFCKDMQLGYDMARKYRVPMPIHQHTMAAFRQCQYQYGDDAACYIPPKALQEALGVELQDQRFKDWDYDTEIIKDILIVKNKGIKD